MSVKAFSLALAAGALVLCVGGNESFAEDFTLTIHRQYTSEQCTSGYLAINGEIKAYTLELPWQGNEPEISSIPSGEYSANLRYDHADKWRIELRDVPARSLVQIHTGNLPADSIGCILIGQELGDDLCSIKPGTSGPANRALREAFYGTSDPIMSPNKQIRVKIEGGSN
ncbi:DUF5675 family protein [Mesorhizobium sp. BR1-1-9]|uniref:DUF5675 family protein n=1 Tax=unclassified Mesorhizobium TaxID=325217 RepID=UPI001CD1495A|nr:MULTISPECIES: DUF5675 family protein [unclassified Mesorhizobium]MBZ9872941.1 DUF5675 family protein [Mesorhizobium sp. BR1-1-9]MBZ9944092.1 DUF5675 family protein [Mesorhizobium sp. BR1-1-13]